MKLHVGCGKIIKAGYKHQDIVDYPHIDYRSPSWEIDEGDNVFDEIFSRHFFEHLHPWEAEDTLKEWHRVLKKDGIIVMSLPDLDFHIKQFHAIGDSELMARKVSNRDHALAGLYGWCDRKHPWMAHRWGYTRESLKVLLSKYFKVIEFQKCKACDISVIAKEKI